MKRIQLGALALLIWSSAGFAACGFMPVIEVRNTGFNQVKDRYDQVTLYCPKAFLAVKAENTSRQEGTLASNLLEDGKDGVCWLSATRNGKQEKLLSFSANLQCSNKNQNEWGKVNVVGQVQYFGKVCKKSLYSCYNMQGPGLLVAVGVEEPNLKDPMDLKTCVCPVSPY